MKQFSISKIGRRQTPECNGAGLEEGSDQGQAVPDIGEKVIMDLTVSSLTSVILCGL